MEKFRGVDYYGIDELLTEEQRMMRDAVRDWVEAKFLPIVSQHHRDGTYRDRHEGKSHDFGHRATS